MTLLSGSAGRVPKVLQLVLELAQYPILADTIRERMRQELYAHSVIAPEELESEAKEKAIQSQKREGLTNPLVQEPAAIWEKRLARVRDNLTDFYFAHNLPHDLFKEIVQLVVSEGAPQQEVLLSLNPELAPLEVLFAQAEQYEALPTEKQAQVQHHLEEIRVVLIKGMVSEQLAFVSRAKEFLTLSDLRGIYRQRIGRGKIGGKAAGMLLAWRALLRPDPNDPLDIAQHLVIPESYFVGSDVYYDYKDLNHLTSFMNQKYKTRAEIEAEYPEIQAAYRGGRFPEELLAGLRNLLQEVGQHPLIVRSSSLLEDSLGASFAGKYDSFFCPNQGTPEQNLNALTDTITRIYASVLSPDALIYRRQQGLVDYDERMAVLIQKVEGVRYRNWFFPTVAGVAFGRNPFRWTARIRREDGFLRLVWGLGTRAVERVGNDYPRTVALSHPGLRPERRARDIVKYSQHYIDLIDLGDNRFKTLPVEEVMADDYPFLRDLGAQEQEDWVQPLSMIPASFRPQDVVLTFDNLLAHSEFVPLISTLLKKLERQLRYPVDVEFTLELVPGTNPPRPILHLLQCRPLSNSNWGQVPPVPTNVPLQDRLFSSQRLVPQGHVAGIRYIVYIDPWRYSQVPDYATRFELAHVVGRLNQRLESQRFILMGPGRWGSSNADLGVKVSYADIYNARVLVEIASEDGSGMPEASYGTHFFQDLVEAHIHPLALYPEDSQATFNRAFFESAPNALGDLLPADAHHAECIKVIDVPAVSSGRYLEIVMNAEQEKALGFLSHNTQ